VSLPAIFAGAAVAALVMAALSFVITTANHPQGMTQPAGVVRG
jgi:hypothetical protein